MKSSTTTTTTTDISTNSSSSISTFTIEQQITLAIIQRVAGIISLTCSICIMKCAYTYRSRVYHRLMFGLAANLCIWCIVVAIYGTLAIPTQTPNVYGAYGNVTTCTIQGFVAQFGFVVPFYYIALSLYSYQAVVSNFNLHKYMWIEKYIHVGVYIFPFCSSIYLLRINAFNYGGGTACWVASVPFGCGTDSNIGGGEDNSDDQRREPVPCTRGPQNIEDIIWNLTGIPSIIVLLFPTIVMLVLYIKVKRNQSQIEIDAKHVAYQGGMYVVAMYWTYLFSFIDGGLTLIGGKNYFTMTLLASTVETLIGVWVLLVYIKFRTPDIFLLKRLRNNKRKTTCSTRTDSVEEGVPHDMQQKTQPFPRRTSHNRTKSNTTDADCTEWPTEEEIGDGDVNRKKDGISSDLRRESNNDGNNEATTKVTAVAAAASSSNSHSRRSKNFEGRGSGRASFNIFDGTSNADSPWAEFLHGGDSDDEQEDVLESRQWANVVQN